MNHASQSKSQFFAPSSAAAIAASAEYLKVSAEWTGRYSAAQSELSSFLKTRVGASARGFVSSDPLNMASFGVVFDKDPGAGFIAVPAAVAEKLHETGLRGQAYFPDMTTPIGKEAMQKLNAISRAAEQRPLLNTIPGVGSVGIENGRVVLTRAAMTESGVMVIAAPSAVGPNAEVKHFTKSAPAPLANNEVISSRRSTAFKPS